MFAWDWPSDFSPRGIHSMSTTVASLCGFLPVATAAYPSLLSPRKKKAKGKSGFCHYCVKRGRRVGKVDVRCPDCPSRRPHRIDFQIKRRNFKSTITFRQGACRGPWCLAWQPLLCAQHWYCFLYHLKRFVSHQQSNQGKSSIYSRKPCSSGCLISRWASL
jgi:hypothetical protein